MGAPLQLEDHGPAFKDVALVAAQAARVHPAVQGVERHLRGRSCWQGCAGELLAVVCGLIQPCQRQGLSQGVQAAPLAQRLDGGWGCTQLLRLDQRLTGPA